MIEKNLQKQKARQRRVTNGFNTGTRTMKSKKDYKRKKQWSPDDGSAAFKILRSYLQEVPQASHLYRSCNLLLKNPQKATEFFMSSHLLARTLYSPQKGHGEL